MGANAPAEPPSDASATPVSEFPDQASLDQPGAISQAEEEVEPEDAEDWFSRDRVTGDWGGGRTWLEERGITFDMSLTIFSQHAAHGGINTHNAHTIVGTNDIWLTFDLTKMNAVPGGTIYLWADNAWGDGPSTRGWVGDLFGVNGAESGDRPIDIHELWYEQAFFEDTLRFRFGKVSLPCSFDTNDFAWDPTVDFTNYGLNAAPNIPFPGFAFGALGAQLIFTPSDWFYLGAGAADADGDFRETGIRTTFHGPANFFAIYEFGLTPTFTTTHGKLPGHYRFGFWHDPQPKEKFFDDHDGELTIIPLKRDDVGFYVNFDQVLWREKPDVEDNTEGLGAFFRYSFAHGDVNLIEHFWSVGAQYRGLLPTRDDDVFAVGVAQGILARQSRWTGIEPNRETVIETYYKIQLSPWLTLTPDFQWILKPGGSDDVNDAFVAGLRLQASF